MYVYIYIYTYTWSGCGYKQTDIPGSVKKTPLIGALAMLSNGRNYSSP